MAVPRYTWRELVGDAPILHVNAERTSSQPIE